MEANEELMSPNYSLFSYDEVGRRVRVEDASVEIPGERGIGNGEYSAYNVALRWEGRVYCFLGRYDFLTDATGKYVVTDHRRSVGLQITEVDLRPRYRDPDTGVVYQSTFENTATARQQAAGLAAAFFFHARMLRGGLPIKRIAFLAKHQISPAVLEF